MYAAPGLLYLLIRLRGTTGPIWVVILVTAGAVWAATRYEEQLDQVLNPLLAWRDRLLPRPVQLALVPVLALLVAFMIIHGTLRDLPAFVGGSTTAPQTPTGFGAVFRFLFASGFALAAAFVLGRERSS